VTTATPADTAAGSSAAPLPAIRTRGLAKTYRGGVRAVDGVDLDVAPGEFFGLLGPNGAGKTTTIGMLTTRVVPTGGTATVAGIDVIAHPAATKQRIGVVPQTNTLDRSISATENLYYHGRYFGMPRREARERTAALLERFRLADKADVMVDTLSGGMAQRLMVARALMHEPAVLFLDEPTTGLDPQSRIALWDLLVEFNAAGQTILLTTHYMEEADQLCDRVAIMDHGKILALGSPGELKRGVDASTIVEITTEPGHGDDERVRLADALTRVPGVVRSDVRDGELHVFADGGNGLLPRLVAAAEAAGVAIVDLSVTEPTLETVFISLTGRDLRE
jgi:ABC-2 type transport system ATP-binding protein